MTKWIWVLCLSVTAFGARLKDIAMLKGARNNQLFGYGLVIGLPGTGDKANELTESSMGLILKGLGVDVKSQKMDTKNAAAVVVTATLPPFSKVGQQLDIQLASIGTASSLDNGTLMMTSLKGPDGKIYAMAQGKVMVMKREAKGGGGSAGGGASVNLVSGTISGGALLEKEIGWDVSQEKQLKYVINNPDFTTAVRIAKKINDELGGKYAVANDASTVDVMYPYSLESNPIELIAQIESLEVEANRRAKVIINSKTGTVVLGEQVRISPVAIAHGNLKLEIKNQAADGNRGVAAAGQPNAQAGAAGASEGEAAKKIMLVKPGPSISEVVSAINDTGASADDLIAILQALKSSGSLQADLEMQ